MNKQAQIDAWTARPIQVGDSVSIKIDYQVMETVVTGRGKSKKEEKVPKDMHFSYGGTVREIIDTKDGKVFAVEMFSKSIPSAAGKVSVEGRHFPHGIELCKEEWVFRSYTHCGSNPFKSEPPRVTFYNKSVESILSDCGYGRRTDSYERMEVKEVIQRSNHPSEDELVGKSYGGCNFDPYIIDKDGNKKHFQRGLVWTTEQKQQLIESMYNWIEIGKIVFRYKSWEQIAKEMKESGHGYNWDCVDGKQRLNAILDFIQGKFPDLHGNYWKDLSPDAQRHILSYDRVAFAKLEEYTSDADVIRVFLTLNFTGVPMSPDHIKYVQSINV